MSMEVIRGRIYVHKKTGWHYQVICEAATESDLVEVVVYVSMDTESFWVRPTKEFTDGRFALLHGADTQEAE